MLDNILRAGVLSFNIRLCCAQSPTNWGQAVYSAWTVGARNRQLATAWASSTVRSVCKQPKHTQTFAAVTHSQPHHLSSHLTEVVPDLYPLSTSLITTTTTYIN
jgi:hypothetical protein